MIHSRRSVEGNHCSLDLMTPFLSIVIPAYNEEKRLATTLQAVQNFLSKQKYKSEVIVVDDGSRDQTSATTQKYKGQIPTLKILKHKVNLGKGAAVKSGVLNSSGEYVLFADADNSTPIEELDKLLPYATKENYDLVIGSRYTKESDVQIRQPWYRRFLGRTGNLVIQIFLLPGINDTQCGFKLLKGDVARELFPKLTINRFGFDMELLYLAKKKKQKIKVVPVSWLNSAQSRVRPVRDGLKTLGELIKIQLNNLRGVYAT